MAFDLEGVVKDLGFTGEDEKTFRALFGTPERVGVLEKGYLRQSDYSKNQNALKTAQTALEQQIDRLNAEQVEWASLTAKEQDAAKGLRDRLEQSEAKALQLQQRVARIATEAGLDPTKALEGIEQPVARVDPPVAPVIDTSKFTPADQFGTMSEYLFNAMLEIPAIVQEHFDVTGERLDPRQLRDEIKARAGQKNANLDPRVIWEDKYGIPAKREARAAAARAAEITDAETRGFQRARSEAALPIAPSNGHNSPMLRGLDGQPRTSVLQRNAPESGVRSAAAALATGKYRTQTP